MDRAAYENEICQRLELAERIPFRRVLADGWEPSVAKCHDNVNKWVRMNPSEHAVRGWVTYASLGFEIGLTAHSVVRGTDGVKYDITPLENEAAPGDSQRQGMRFVEHHGSDEEFFNWQRERHSMVCPLPADEAAELNALLLSVAGEEP